jgi:hypothetical protein
VTNEGTDSVTELALSNNALVQVVVNSNLATPGPITISDEYIFTASPPGDIAHDQ